MSDFIWTDKVTDPAATIEAGVGIHIPEPELLGAIEALRAGADAIVEADGDGDKLGDAIQFLRITAQRAETLYRQHLVVEAKGLAADAVDVKTDADARVFVAGYLAAKGLS